MQLEGGILLKTSGGRKKKKTKLALSGILENGDYLH